MDFYQPDGSRISNIVSVSEDGDLYMTYAFEWRHPELDGHNQEAIDQMRKKHEQTAQMAVEKSIESIRRMVAEGLIKV